MSSVSRSRHLVLADEACVAVVSSTTGSSPYGAVGAGASGVVLGADARAPEGPAGGAGCAANEPAGEVVAAGARRRRHASCTAPTTAKDVSESASTRWRERETDDTRAS